MPTRQPLANAELAIMELLWEHERLTARQIRERLYTPSEKAQHGTVQRLLGRLEDKGYVRRDPGVGAYLFSAVVSREEYGSSQLETIAARLTAGSLAPLVTHLVEHQRIPPDEIARLRRILDESDHE